MSIIIRFLATLLLSGVLMGCAISGVNGELENHISRLVDETTKSAKTQEKALAELGKLGQQAVWSLIGHLSDNRPLAAPKITLANKASDSFEASRHYSPETVHDAIAAILNQITGESFLFVYNGATPEERKQNYEKWKLWCKSNYPGKIEACGNEP